MRPTAAQRRSNCAAVSAPCGVPSSKDSASSCQSRLRLGRSAGRKLGCHLWCHGTWYCGTPRAGTRTAYVQCVAPRGSYPAPQVRRRLVRVARTYSTEAPGRTCKLRLPPTQSLEQVRPGAEEAAALLLLRLLRRRLRLGGAPRSRQEQQPSPALRAAAEQHAQPRPGGRAVGAGARCAPSWRRLLVAKRKACTANVCARRAVVASFGRGGGRRRRFQPKSAR
eukprot:scaffold115266_cov65-Phaeocystis_antarctica.AAC.2